MQTVTTVSRSDIGAMIARRCRCAVEQISWQDADAADTDLIATVNKPVVARGRKSSAPRPKKPTDAKLTQPGLTSK